MATFVHNPEIRNNQLSTDEEKIIARLRGQIAARKAAGKKTAQGSFDPRAVTKKKK